MISSLLHFDVIHFHPLPSLCPPFLSVFVLSVNVLDGGLSPGKHHYSHFLCNVNDGDPLFISDLLITPQPIAYPPRQGSHIHSRHYFIKRARLQWAVMDNAVIMQVWCMQLLSSSSERKVGWVSLLPRSKLPYSLLARKGQDTTARLYWEFLYNFCNFMEQRAGSETYPGDLLFSTHGKWCALWAHDNLVFQVIPVSVTFTTTPWMYSMCSVWCLWICLYIAQIKCTYFKAAMDINVHLKFKWNLSSSHFLCKEI